MAHTYSNLLVHALFSTKDRAPLLDAELKPQLFSYMGGIIAQLRGKPILIGAALKITCIFYLCCLAACRWPISWKR
jgi:hypothetical protein